MIDGALAAQFLQFLKNLLEEPYSYYLRRDEDGIFLGIDVGTTGCKGFGERKGS